MKRPAFQFYPDNWRNSANLQRCSWAARGVWIEVMCLMHDSDRYGVLEWPLKEIAQALGCTIAPLKELIQKKVLKGCESGDCDPMVYVPRSGRRDGPPVTLIDVQPGPIWFSSRMIKDEYKRQTAGASTRFGADETPPNASSRFTPSLRQGASPNHAPSRREGDGSPSPSPSPTTLNTEDRGEARRRAARERAPPPVPRPDDVPEPVWADWLQLRKAKRAPVTGTTLSEARTEAGKAGMPLERFLAIWCGRGSQGLQADWVRPNERNGSAAADPAWRVNQRELMRKAAPYAFSGPPAPPKLSPKADEVFDVIPLPRPASR